MEECLSLKNQDEQLFAIVHKPEAVTWANNVMIVFLHGWAGYRIGPHRMFVHYARCLARQGYYCLRFDFRGRGFSEGFHEQASIPSMISDLNVVLEQIESTFHPQHIVLLGICSGAKVAIYISGGSRKIDHIIALSSQALWQDRPIKTEAVHTRAILNEYLKKIWLKETWKKAFSGQIHTSLILNIILKPVRRYFSAKSITTNARESPDETAGTPALPQPFHNFTGEILLIHGENDPETAPALEQISLLCEEHHVPYSYHVVPGANHSFYSVKWEQQIYELIENWLAEKFNLARG